MIALEASLTDPRGGDGFQHLKDDVGATTLDNVLDASHQLALIQDLGLPFVAFSAIDPSWVKMLMRRVEGETASEMRRHNREKRLGLLAVYLMSRRSQMIDGLVDLLIEVVHHIGTRSKRKVISSIAANIEKVHGKERLLVEIATEHSWKKMSGDMDFQDRLKVRLCYAAHGAHLRLFLSVRGYCCRARR